MAEEDSDTPWSPEPRDRGNSTDFTIQKAAELGKMLLDKCNRLEQANERAQEECEALRARLMREKDKVAQLEARLEALHEDNIRLSLGAVQSPIAKALDTSGMSDLRGGALGSPFEDRMTRMEDLVAELQQRNEALTGSNDQLSREVVDLRRQLKDARGRTWSQQAVPLQDLAAAPGASQPSTPITSPADADLIASLREQISNLEINAGSAKDAYTRLLEQLRATQADLAMAAAANRQLEEENQEKRELLDQLQNVEPASAVIVESDGLTQVRLLQTEVEQLRQRIQVLQQLNSPQRDHPLTPQRPARLPDEVTPIRELTGREDPQAQLFNLQAECVRWGSTFSALSASALGSPEPFASPLPTPSLEPSNVKAAAAMAVAHVTTQCLRLELWLRLICKVLEVVFMLQPTDVELCLQYDCRRRASGSVTLPGEAPHPALLAMWEILLASDPDVQLLMERIMVVAADRMSKLREQTAATAALRTPTRDADGISSSKVEETKMVDFGLPGSSKDEVLSHWHKLSDVVEQKSVSFLRNLLGQYNTQWQLALSVLSGYSSGRGITLPGWVPDEDTSKCSHCQQEFTVLFLRRHHCRTCGKIYCSLCSSKRVDVAALRIPGARGEPVRVCDPCYNVLCHAHD